MNRLSLIASTVALTCAQSAPAEGRIVELHDSGAISEASAVTTGIDAPAAAATCRRSPNSDSGPQ